MRPKDYTQGVMPGSAFEMNLLLKKQEKHFQTERDDFILHLKNLKQQNQNDVNIIPSLK